MPCVTLRNQCVSRGLHDAAEVRVRRSIVIDLKTFVSEHCSWCGVRVPHHDKIHLGVQLEMSPDENALLGRAVELDVEGYVITGIMFQAGSEEKREGFDLSMIACCAECADQAMLHAGKASIALRPLLEASVRSRPNAPNSGLQPTWTAAFLPCRLCHHRVAVHAAEPVAVSWRWVRTSTV